MLKNNLLYILVQTKPKYDHVNDFCMYDDQAYKIFNEKLTRLNLELNQSTYLEKAKLFPEYGIIASITIAYQKDDKTNIKVITGNTEKEILEEFNKIITTAGRTICGWNIKNFDIPWIIKKCVLYDLLVSPRIFIYGAKPWEQSFCDLKEIWKMNMDCTLDDACVGLNIPIEDEDNKIKQIVLLSNKIKQIA
jgi:DNA polymerase elongation subunit (family B)